MVGLNKVLGWMLVAMLEKVLLESYAVIREFGLKAMWYQFNFQPLKREGRMKIEFSHVAND